MRIIQSREIIEGTNYFWVFEYTEGSHKGSGFQFSLTPERRIDIDSMSPAAKSNYYLCVSGANGIKDMGIVGHSHSYTAPAIGLCECGEEVSLDSFTNTCGECLRDYNMSGQLLADRSQWGEETGESLSDILNIK